MQWKYTLTLTPVTAGWDMDAEPDHLVGTTIVEEETLGEALSRAREAAEVMLSEEISREDLLRLRSRRHVGKADCHGYGQRSAKEEVG